MIYYIYKIQIGDFIYIGSTRDYTKRYNKHRYNAYMKHRVLYQKIEEAGGLKPIMMSLVETIDCEQKDARICEQKWIEHYSANMNMVNAHLTEEAKKERSREEHRLYRERHHDELLQKRRLWMEENREEWNKYCREYAAANREKTSQIQKRWRDKKRAELSQKQLSQLASLNSESTIERPEIKTEIHLAV